MNPDSRLAAQFRSFVASELRDERVETLSATFQDVPSHALAWMAASTSIPVRGLLALLPSPGAEAIVERLKTNRLLEATGRTWISDAEQFVRITRSGRDSLLEAITTSDRSPHLQSDLARAGSLVMSAGGLPEATARLVQLASISGAEVFEHVVDEAFANNDSTTIAEWLSIARPLADLLARTIDSSLDVAVQRAVRRLELLRRGEEDIEHLASFVVRPEQVAAIHELLDGDPERWALHLLGAGGVGKTMLLRYVATAVARSRHLATARIDFDYLNADYPRLDPGRLLWSFAHELQLHSSGRRASEYFQKSIAALTELRKLLASPSSASLRATQHPFFIDAIRFYIVALQQLPSPVLLIFDTCEELAKIRPSGEIPDNVQETFRILGALRYGPHYLTSEQPQNDGGSEGLRVIFAGRRPLASQGDNWTSDSWQLPPRPFLRVHELRGFTIEESQSYLGERLQVPQRLVQPIIRSSPESDPPAKIQYTDDRAKCGERVEAEPRSNPYLLHLFGQWAREAPDAEEQIAAGVSTRRYIELRILRRITHPPLAELMPLIATARHVDAALLAAAAGRSVEEIAPMFHELTDQEWAETRRITTAEGSKVVVSVKTRLQRELVAYYEGSRGSCADAFGRAADYLEHRTLHDPLETLDWSIFDAALRLLEDDVERGGRWWRQVEARAVRDRGFRWLRDLTGNLLGEGNAAAAVSEKPQEDNRLRPFVAVTHTAAQLHLGEPRGDALLLADTYPEDIKSESFRLAVRAAALRVMVAADRSHGELKRLLKNVRRALAAGVFDTQLAPSILGALEATLDEEMPRDAAALRAVMSSDHAFRTLRDFTEMELDTDRTRADTLKALTLLIRTRVTALRGAWLDANEFFARARAAARRVKDAQCTFIDWPQPANLQARIWIDGVRLLYPRILSCGQALDIMRRLPIDRIDNADEERYFSLLLSLIVAQGDRNAELTLPTVDLTTTYPAACAAHRAIPPLFVSVAHFNASVGRIETAIDSLTQQLSARDLTIDAIRHIERTLHDLAFRIRTGTEVFSPGRSLVESLLPSDRLRVWLLDALTPGSIRLPLPDEQESDPNWLHARFESLCVFRNDDRAELEIWSQQTDRASQRQFRSAVGADDAIPMTHLQLLRNGLDADEAAIAIGSLPQTNPKKGIGNVPQDDPREVLLVCVRAAALEQPYPDAPRIEDLRDHLGRVAAAELVLTTAEHMALRVPRAAIVLFDLAEEWFAGERENAPRFFARAGGALARIAAGKAVDQKAFETAFAGLLATGANLGIDLKSTTPNGNPAIWRPWAQRVLVIRAAGTGPVRPSRELAEPVSAWIGTDPKTLAPDLFAALRSFAKPFRQEERTTWTRYRGTLVSGASVLAIFAGLYALSGRVYSLAGVQKSDSIVEGILFVVAALVFLGALMVGATKGKNESRVTALSLVAIMVIATAASFWQSSGDTLHYIRWLHVTVFLSLAFLPWVALWTWWPVENRGRHIQARITRSADERYTVVALSTIPRLRLIPYPSIDRRDRLEETRRSYQPDLYDTSQPESDPELTKMLQGFLASTARTLPFEINATPPHSRVRWEQVLTAGLPPPVRFDLFRTVPGLVSVDFEGPFAVEAWGVSRESERTSRGVWGGAAQFVSGSLRSRGITAATVLHLIGVVDDRTSGVELRLGGYFDESPYFSAAEISRIAPSAALIVLQGEPSVEQGVRRDAESWEAGISRELAAELSRSRMAAVLTIPRLHISAAEAAIQCVADVVVQVSILDRRQLHDLVRHIQLRVGEGAAGDVVLFCPPEWRYRKS